MRSSFQTIILVVFAIAFVGAVAVFSGIFSSGKKSTSSEPQGSVIVWGVLPNEQMQQFVSEFNSRGLKYSLVYSEHSPQSFAQELTVALADGVPPDAVIVSSEIFSQFKDKLYQIPYSVYSERTFRDTNIDGAKIFLAKDGVISVPFLVDPLVVYYNKDILASVNYVLPPATWADLGGSVSLLTKSDVRNNIVQSTIALGETQNIDHFRDILSAIFLQVGNPIISVDNSSGLATATLNDGTRTVDNTLPTSDAVNFYTSFSNPNNSLYSWNKSMPQSIDVFISGRSAFYIGRASELFTIQAQNPNLNFDVMELFQADDAPRPITFGSFIGASILKNAQNFPAAYAFIASLSADIATIDQLSKLFSLPPTNRQLLLVAQDNPYVSVFFKAALSSFSWPDPNMSRTQDAFRGMITGITSGRINTDAAINEADQIIQSNIR